MANFPLTYFDSTATANDYGGTDVTKVCIIQYMM